jgi:uncharacterized protein
MKQAFYFLFLIFLAQFSFAQKQSHYAAYIRSYQKQYVAEHEVVKKADKKYFRFFPADSTYKVTCSFIKITDTTGFTMRTSAGTTKQYYKYGQIGFTLHDTAYYLFVYQSKDLMTVEKYKEYLFVPFTDATTGDESYGSGRYLEFYIHDIRNDTLQLDFNKAYNPYCAYATGYHCPIPPKENYLNTAIRAGEKTFAKPH